MDQVRVLVFILHLAYFYGWLLPSIGKGIAIKCSKNRFCGRYLVPTSWGYHIDLADGQWREFRGSLWILCMAAVGTSVLSLVATTYLKQWKKISIQRSAKVLSTLRIIVGLITLFIQHGYHSAIIIGIAGIGYILSQTFCHIRPKAVVTESTHSASSSLLEKTSGDQHHANSYKSSIAVWTFAVFILLFKESYRLRHIAGLQQFLVPLFDRRYGGMYGWQLPSNFLVLRIVSYCLDFQQYQRQQHRYRMDDSDDKDRTADEKEKGGGDAANACRYRYGLIHYFAYVLYAPLYMAGPIITFDAFVAGTEQSLQKNRNSTKTVDERLDSLGNIDTGDACGYSNFDNSSPNSSSASSSSSSSSSCVDGIYVILYLLRWIGCFLLMEFLLNQFPFFAVVSSNMMKHLSPVEIAVVCYVLLKIMWLKFLLLWRFFRWWALADGMRNTPENMTKCMSNNHSLEGFWKGWHSSYNKWLVRYLYKPLGGRSQRYWSVWIIFLFVAMWHDFEIKLLMWGILNAIFFVIEVSVKYVAVTQLRLPQRLSPTVYQLICAVGGASYIMVLIGVNLTGYALGVGGISFVLRKFQTIEGLYTILGSFYFLVIGVLIMQFLKAKGVSKDS